MSGKSITLREKEEGGEGFVLVIGSTFFPPTAVQAKKRLGIPWGRMEMEIQIKL